MRVAPSSSSRSRSRYYSPSCCSTGNRHRLDRRFSREQVQVHHGYCLEAPPEREGGAEVPPGVELRGAHRVAGQPVQELEIDFAIYGELLDEPKRYIVMLGLTDKA